MKILENVLSSLKLSDKEQYILFDNINFHWTRFRVFESPWVSKRFSKLCDITTCPKCKSHEYLYGCLNCGLNFN